MGFPFEFERVLPLTFMDALEGMLSRRMKPLFLPLMIDLEDLPDAWLNKIISSLTFIPEMRTLVLTSDTNA